MNLWKLRLTSASLVWHLFSYGLLVVLLLSSARVVMAQPPTETQNPYYKFQCFSKKDGLASNHILYIFQDKLGFMWFATDRGLSRYDGYSFVNFFHVKNDENSLSGTVITCLAEDTSGNLWVGTDRGIDRYVRSKNLFKHFEIGKKGNERSKHVRALFIDDKNILWIETADGFLSEIDISGGKHKRFEHEKPGQLEIYRYHNIYKGKSGKLWIGGRSFGPLCFNKTNEQFVSYSSSPKDIFGKSTKDITCFYQDKRGVFWVAGVDGLYRFDTINRKFYRLLKGSVFDVKEGQNGNLWIGTGHGLKIWDRVNQQLISIRRDVENPASLPNDHITKLFFDRSGCLWIGTVDGLAKYSFYSNKFQTCFHIPGNAKTPSSSYITALMEDQKGNIWVGTDDAGIDVLNRHFKKINHFDPFSRIPLASNRVSVLYEDKKGNIWVGLWSGTGFQEINRNRTNSKLFRLDTTSRNMDWYNGFCEDDIGNFWVASWSSYGLFRFNGHAFVDKKNKPGCLYPLGSHFVSALMKDKDGFLWVGSTDGSITCMNPVDKSATVFSDNLDDSTSFWGSNVRFIYQDKEGTVWIGGYGLNKFCAKDNTFSHYTVNNGLADNQVKGIIEDDSRRLWIGTARGLSLFDKAKGVFVNFYVKDGLPDDEFTRAVCRLSDGRLLFGTKRGLVVIYPHRVTFNKIPPQPMVTSVRVLDKTFPFDYTSQEPLELTYKQNYVSFRVSASDYNYSKENMYAFKLVNFDREWKYCCADDRLVQYANLPPGSYYFMLKVANPDGFWSAKPLRISMIITPPFWKTTWFHLLEMLFLISLMLVFVLYREKRIRQKHKVELLQQKLLRTQMNPHFIFNALGAIQSYVIKNNSLASASYLSKFANLMRSILTGSRKEFISLDEELDILRNYLTMQQLRFENKFEYFFDIDEALDTQQVMIPPMLTQPFVENAVEHGLKGLDKKGIIKVKVWKEGEMLLISIEDNGMGIGSVHSHKEKKHKSMALEITRERLQILNRNVSKRYTFSVEAVRTATGGITGTRVVYSIPLNEN